MRFIAKKNEPLSLRNYRSSAGATFEGLPSKVKTDIKNQLLDEQGHTCAYCMQQIKFEAMKVEHWLPQSSNNNKSSTLDYKNLLGCCEGNEKKHDKKKDIRTCDTKKANDLIKFSPANPRDEINRKIKYLSSGKILSQDQVFNLDIENKLNLNLGVMVENRKVALESIKSRLNQLSGDKRCKSKIQKLLDKVSNKGRGNKYTPFYGVAIDYLNKKLR
ncbi:TIGR02646 family protein [Photobacterium frigidiphilum]|uniref:TIGR02646 family protein n=1 Tax=Photobacterium frigidiphilum TaxID=264736 RepID=A0A2T3JGV0_9GAMM|nr:retron system putative HNH endonuclease [Photobacterium frigidiphilum]PSU48153.1 TIGR02646 family protein [Photobacterium frigidiphilum]